MDYTPVSDLAGDLSFAAPAKIRILLTPIRPGVGTGSDPAATTGVPGSSAAGSGGISTKEFEKWADQVRSFASIKLSDLPRNNGSGRKGPSELS
jgi:hypothetical protein